ncbi:techylectin-5B-like [Drosophila grimshawi]|uniref:techylectin-5B-like n=1 Tax=Drosophila grimshawi TaxID=7222 RepID=UPI001C9321BB|nr:techylectin-5B-like [Drosophila grimshawi]
MQTSDEQYHLIDSSGIQSEQIRLRELQNELIGKFYVLNENFNRLTSSESNKFASSCAEATALSRRSGVYQILVRNYSLHPIIVSCEEETHGGGWTTVLRRQDGSVDFYRFWKDFKNGFGNVIGEFFIGLELLHIITNVADQELLIVMEDFNGRHRFAKYDQFEIGSEDEAYKLRTLGTYSGDAGDSLKDHLGLKFSTRDRDNDQKDTFNCAEIYTGGWWYDACYKSHLMGKYQDSSLGAGINWYPFATSTGTLKGAQMMIRPRRY